MSMLPNHFMHRALVFVLGLAILVANGPAISQDRPLQATTQETIKQLIQASALITSGRPGDARALIQGMSESIRQLDEHAHKFRLIANSEHARCSQRIGDLDVETTKLFVQQTEINEKINSLTADLTRQATLRNLAAAEIERLNKQLMETVQSMRDRQARLEEMQKWWWVPGYGQYLSIRTLVDGDIGRYNQAINELRDQQHRLATNSDTQAQAQALITTLSREKQQAEALNAQLGAMRALAQNRLRDLNGMAVFLTDADVFWGLAENLLEVDGESFIRKLNIIQNVLARDVASPSFKDPSISLAQKFQQKLVEFADSVDKQSNFLLSDKTDFCGGPALALNTAISTRCNINQITAYYEIVDPKTCAFRYLNPPGCPPAAKPVNTSTDAVSRGRTRGNWTQAAGQNWIGRPSTSPCSTAGTIYYGKLAGPEQCEAICMSDAECTIWSFNTNNGFMPDSISQCWGGPASLDANKSSWGGFVSGGIR